MFSTPVFIDPPLPERLNFETADNFSIPEKSTLVPQGDQEYPIV